jgi:hypothetical protein
MAKPPKKGAEPAKPVQAPLFEDPHLALCVVEALVDHDLIETSLRIPELEPDDDDDLDDESESWRDRIDNNQTEVIAQLLALVEQHRDKLPQLREIQGALIHIAEDYEPDIDSLAGIEACTGLERIGIWSTSAKLDLSPLKSLPALTTVDLTCASGVKKLDPLLEIPSLKVVIGNIHARMGVELRKRNVEVKKSGD